MTNEQNKAIPRRFFKAMETNDQAAMKELLAPNFKQYPVGSSEPMSREVLLQTLAQYKEAFSDQIYTIIDQVAEGDKVTTRTTWEATHTGDFQGLPATGKRVLVGGIAISHIQNGKIVERWLSMDQMGMLRQLGLVP